MRDGLTATQATSGTVGPQVATFLSVPATTLAACLVVLPARDRPAANEPKAALSLLSDWNVSRWRRVQVLARQGSWPEHLAGTVQILCPWLLCAR